ncbi:MAG: sensor histidine kinase [Acidobacteriota bacterium]
MSPSTTLGETSWGFTRGKNITAQKQQDALPRQLEVVLAQMHDAVLITEAWPIDAEEGGPRILYVNPAFERMTGYTYAEVIGKTPRFLQGPRTQREALKKLRSALEQWQPMRVELINYRKDGREFSVDITLSPVTDPDGRVVYWVSLQRDTTEEKALVAKLEALLAERQVLLQEVHHRVKNNFQTIISLLELQSEHLGPTVGSNIVRDLASRIQSMALIHEQLYQQSNFSRVLLDELGVALMEHLQQVFSTPSVEVVWLPGRVALPVYLAVPVALILHELLLNAFKHGVAAGARHITARSERTPETVTIEVVDDGLRHPPDLPEQLVSSRQFGLRMVRLLAEQLRGQIAFTSKPGGFCAVLTFPTGEDGSVQGNER